jgi:carbon-monoxide dehydrogenase iron sulfur subunit
MQVLNKSQVTEKKFVAADLEKCTGCGVCELVCALKREKVYNPQLSRIKILRLYRLVNISIACKLCENAPCVTACPLDCLVQSEKTGVILVNEEKCDCCGWCMEACPYGAIVLNPEKETVMMCDLCGGEPQCVEWCPEKALELVTQKEFDANLRNATANRLIDETWSAETIGNEVETEQAKEREVAGFLRELSENEEKRESLNLLVEAFSEPKPLDVLIYGMYVKKHLAFMVPGASVEKIGKTLKWLGDAIKLVENSGKR